MVRGGGQGGRRVVGEGGEGPGLPRSPWSLQAWQDPGGCRHPTALWVHLGTWVAFTGGRDHWGLRGGPGGEVRPSPFLGVAAGVAGSLSTFLRCLPPVRRGCLQSRPGPGPGQVWARGRARCGMGTSWSLHTSWHLWPTCLEGIMRTCRLGVTAGESFI